MVFVWMGKLVFLACVMVRNVLDLQEPVVGTRIDVEMELVVSFATLSTQTRPVEVSMCWCSVVLTVTSHGRLRTSVGDSTRNDPVFYRIQSFRVAVSYIARIRLSLFAMFLLLWTLKQIIALLI